MNPISWMLIAAGVVLIIIGAAGGGLLGPLGRLPGDIVIRRPGFTLYLPLATSIFISLALTALFWLFQRFR